MCNTSHCLWMLTPQPHLVRQRTRTPRLQRTKMGLMCIYGYIHTEVHVRQHDRGWVLTPNMHWRMVQNVAKSCA